MERHIKQFYIDMLAYKHKIVLDGRYARWRINGGAWPETTAISSFWDQDLLNNWYVLWIARIANKARLRRNNY